MMQKNPLKKCAFLLLLLLVIGLTGLIVGFMDSNRNYERALSHIQYLQANLGDLHGRLLALAEESMGNEKKYARSISWSIKTPFSRRNFPTLPRSSGSRTIEAGNSVSIPT